MMMLLKLLVQLSATLNGAQFDAHINLQGINSIPILGTPGTMAVWGEDSFPVIVGKDASQPIAVAAEYADGRFFAIAHGSYIGGLKDGNGSQFMTQVAKWVSQKEAPRFGTLKNNTKNWDDVDLLMWGQNTQLSPENELKLLEWIASGGGVIASACPWGWAQVTGKSLQTELSQNRVMATLGMQYGGNYARGVDGVFKVSPLAEEINASIALKQIATTGTCSAVGSGALQYAVQVSPEFRSEVNKVISSEGMQGPTNVHQVKVEDVRSRLFVTNFSSDWKNQLTEDVLPAQGSEVFPGTVDASATL